MGKGTGIQWCDDTVNPTSGCDGCELWTLTGVPYEHQVEAREPRRKSGPCYAGNMQEGRLALAMPKLYSADFTEVRMIPGRMAKAVAATDLTGTARPEKPWLDGMPRMIFVGDMGDIFSEAVTFPFLKEEIIDQAVSKNGRRHILMLLTKRPRQANLFAGWLKEKGIEWPENVWAGTSITSDKHIQRARTLADHPARFKFLSLEPLWTEVTFPQRVLGRFALQIIGGESSQRGHEAHAFDIEWARSLIAQGNEAGIKTFVKQLGSLPVTDSVHGERKTAIVLRDSHGGDWSEWPEDLRVREVPVVGQAVAP